MSDNTRKLVVSLAASFVVSMPTGLFALGFVLHKPWLKWAGLYTLCVWFVIVAIVALVISFAAGAYLLRDHSEAKASGRPLRVLLALLFLGTPIFIVVASIWLWMQ